MSKLLTISTHKGFTLSHNGVKLAEFFVLDPKPAPIQIMDNISRAREIERQLEAGCYPDPILQSKFNALFRQN